MKLLVFLVILAISAATTQGFQKPDPTCTVCKRTVNWVRANKNVKHSILSDKNVPPSVKVIVSDVHVHTVCAHLAMCKVVFEDDHPIEDEHHNDQHHHHHHHHHHHIDEHPKPARVLCPVNGKCN